MGSSYTNITCIDCELDDLVAYLHEDDIAAYVVPVRNAIVVFPAEAEVEDEQTLGDIGARLSAATEGIAITALNRDDASLAVGVYEHGDERAWCSTDPEYDPSAVADPVVLLPEADEDELEDEPFDDEEDEEAELPLPFDQARQQAEAMVEVLRPEADVEAVAAALSDPDFVLATERHEALVEELALPREAVGTGYAAIAEDPGSIDFDAAAALRVT